MLSSYWNRWAQVSIGCRRLLHVRLDSRLPAAAWYCLPATTLSIPATCVIDFFASIGDMAMEDSRVTALDAHP